MNKTHSVMALAIALLFAGSWTTAHAQTGDCFTLAPGCLDTSFGTNGNGEAVMKIGNYSYAAGIALEPVIQPDGTSINKIVAATQAYSNGNPVFGVIRYNLDGSLDTSFNGTGIVVSNAGGYVQGIAVQNDGKILVVGFTSNLVRFNVDGSLDSGFGSGGVVTIPPTRSSSAATYAVAIQNDNKIVVAGSTSGMTAWRFNANGSVDSIFGSGGTITLSFGKTASSRALALALQTVTVNGTTEQRIVLGGWANSGTKPTKSSGYDNFALARLTASGQLDTSFGSSGEVVRDFAGYTDVIRGLVIDQQNGIVAAGFADLTGSSSGGGSQFAIARYNASGRADLNFGSNGAVTLRILSGDNHARSVALQSDGSIVVAGDAYTSASKAYLAVARFTSLGVRDGTFGSGGFVTTDFSSFGSVGAVGDAMVLQPDGRILVGGEVELVVSTSGSSSEVGLARFLQ